LLLILYKLDWRILSGHLALLLLLLLNIWQHYGLLLVN